jgi:hypothetical protein
MDDRSVHESIDLASVGEKSSVINPTQSPQPVYQITELSDSVREDMTVKAKATLSESRLAELSTTQSEALRGKRGSYETSVSYQTARSNGVAFAAGSSACVVTAAAAGILVVVIA